MSAQRSALQDIAAKLATITKKERPLTPTSASGKQLYAISYIYMVSPGVWKGDFLYVHASDAGDARLQYFQSNDPEVLQRRHVRIEGVAPVIGYFVNDAHGDDLSVD